MGLFSSLGRSRWKNRLVQLCLVVWILGVVYVSWVLEGAPFSDKLGARCAQIVGRSRQAIWSLFYADYIWHVDKGDGD